MTYLHDPEDFAVLVVEDDPLLEEVGLFGYGARNADEAIRRMGCHPAIRVIVTDIEMPGSMDGHKLARYVRDHWPPVMMVVISGRNNVAPADLPEDAVFFAAPCSPGAVMTTLRQAAANIRP